MARKPPDPPHVINGLLTQAVIDWITNNTRDNETNIGSVVSGVNEAKAAAAAAQATASGAAANANNANASAGGGFSVAITPDSSYGEITGPGPVSTSSITATPTGGTAPYTYAWTLASGATLFTIQNDTAPSTGFDTVLPLFNGETRFDIVNVTVTDSLLATCMASSGAVAVSNNTSPF